MANTFTFTDEELRTIRAGLELIQASDVDDDDILDDDGIDELLFKLAEW